MKKILPYLLVALLLATSALAGTAYRYTDSVTTIRGDAVGGASVYVYQANTTTKVTLYSGPHSGFTQQSNPVSTDGYGRFTFFVEPGTYDLYVYGSNIVPYTLQDVRIFGDAGYTYNVLDYGAVAGDSGDDTSAFQSTVAAAISAGGGVVEVPDGTFKVANLKVRGDNVTIKMSSAAVIDCDSTAYAAINVDASERFAMIGGKLTGPGELVSTSNGVLIDSCYAARFEDVEVEEFRNGIRATNQTTHTLYSGLYMHDIKFTGLWPHSGDIVTGCRFEDIGTLSTHHGIYIDQSSSDIVLSGNYYKDISGAGVQIYSPTEGFSDISCTGEVFERCGVGYIIAGTPAVRINVSGAVIDSCQNLSSSETITGVGIQLIGTAKNVSIQAIVSYPDSLAFNSNVNLSDSTFDISAVGSGLDGIRFYGKDCTGSFSVDDCAAIGFYMGAGMRNNLLVKARGNASNGIYLSGNSKRNLLNVISTNNLVGVGLAAGSDSNVVYGAAGANSSSQLGNSGTGNTTTGLVTW